MDLIFGEEDLSPRVVSVKPQQDYILVVTFSDGVKRQYDVKPLFETPLYKNLPEVFHQVSIDYGTVVWPGNLDISPDTLYLDGTPIVD